MRSSRRLFDEFPKFYCYFRVCEHICIYAHIYAYMRAYMHICSHICIYASIYAYMRAYMHICSNIHFIHFPQFFNKTLEMEMSLKEFLILSFSIFSQFFNKSIEDRRLMYGGDPKKSAAGQFICSLVRR